LTRILLVGGGGREHAIAWRLKRDDPSLDLIAAPGNPGIAALARVVPVGPLDIDGLVALARDERVDAVVVGPEGPLELGLADRIAAAGIPVFGPSAAAAMLETSKSFAKDIMREANVPTAHATTHTDAPSAKRAAAALGAPVVIKASGLAAGKGVVVCTSLQQAEGVIDDFLETRTLGAAGNEVLIEEFMSGEEVSLFVLTDGVGGVPLVPAQDHKRLLAGDEGPNTGGMGAYAPLSVATPGIVQQTMERVVTPTLAVMRSRGTPFRGLLYVGLMLTQDGLKVVEFNCRFGDPETQAVLPILHGSLLDAMLSIARGDGISGVNIRWDGRYAVSTVIAAHGYPGKVRTGDVITLPPITDNVIVFHAGTSRNANGDLVTAGGRVLAVTAFSSTFAAAQATSRNGARAVRFDGMQFRDDIGWREKQRRA
jgi:phosphoribosylamine--glycine ligase